MHVSTGRNCSRRSRENQKEFTALCHLMSVMMLTSWRAALDEFGSCCEIAVGLGLPLGVVPIAIKITEAEYRKMADEIITQLRSAGVAIHDNDIRRSSTRFSSTRRGKKALDTIHDAFEELTVPDGKGR